MRPTMLRTLARPASTFVRCSRVSTRQAAWSPSALPVSALRQTRFASTKAYTEDHEWVSFDAASKIGTVGITDYAQKSLGDVVFVELPAAGSEVKKQDQIGAVESVKAASDIFAPVSGTIESINEALGDQPALLNRSPEGDGWLCKIKLSDVEEIKGLMDEAAYKAHCEGQE